MSRNRAVNRRRTASGMSQGGGNGANISFASGRPKDPMFYWRENNMPWGVEKNEDLEKIRAFLRLLYLSHPVLASVVDIYSKWPILDLEFRGKNDKLNEFYSDLFLYQLDYEEFLIDVGREYWLTGEAFPLGSFNETLGVWEADELINPDDVKVIRSPFLKEPRFEMKLPEVIRNIMINRDPKWEYEALIRNYPQMVKFSREDSLMPVSNVLLKHLKFKGDSFHPRGLPIWMRGFRTIIQEEMLNAAQDAIAERLYTPLTVFKLGASATDLGTTVPWVPNQNDLESFEYALDAALAGDFRVLVTHFAVEHEQVYGKETMPDFNDDFDRLTDRLLQVVGLSRTMLTGAGQGETYAADALNRDLVSQILGTYQKKIKRLVKDRMLVVAEAQEHYDYDERNGIKYVKYEEILETDPESGEQTIVEQPKLLVPDVSCATLNLQDETTTQQLKEALRESGVPISMKTRLINVPIDFDEEIEVSREEQIKLAVADQETRKKTFLALREAKLPIPEDLRKDFMPQAQEVGKGNPATADPPDQDSPSGDDDTGEQPLPSIGLDQAAPTAALAPTDADIDAADPASSPTNEDLANSSTPTETTPAAGAAPADPLPTNRFKNRPPESDEMRSSMPKKSSLDPDEPGSLEIGPSHIGMRRFATNIGHSGEVDTEGRY
jgi:hypothetical protein